MMEFHGTSSAGGPSILKMKRKACLDISSMKRHQSMTQPTSFSSGGGTFGSWTETQKAVSPEPSYVSVKSDWSMGMPFNFSIGNVLTDLKRQKSRSESPEPSCVSVKSDWSMGMPFNFSGNVPTDLKMKRAASVEPSFMKRHRFMTQPTSFSSGGGTFGSWTETQKAVSPEPSWVSVKSDWSMGMPFNFSSGNVLTDLKRHKSRSESPEPSCVSVKSDWSMGMPFNFSSGNVPTDLKDILLQNLSRYGVCQQYLTDPVSITCRQCISRYRGQSAQSGDFVYPYYRKISKAYPVPNPHMENLMFYQEAEYVLERHKSSMKNRYESLFEGIKTQENKTLLNRIYTQLYIIEGESKGVNEEHEVLQMEKTSRKQLQDTPINYLDIFKPVEDPKGEMEEQNIRYVMANSVRQKERQEDEEPKQLRTVLTKGIAGIGKTVSVQKFILDWAEGKANRDVDFMFVLPFRELNLIKDDQFSLHGLLCDFHPELKGLDPKIFDSYKVVFIFDGLDESRIPLSFSHCEKVSDITMTSSLEMLMTNLIRGDLLPSAHIWITSRPAAANQIPPEYIDRVTEIQGFNDPQKEEYFRKRIGDQDKAMKIISHIKKARSLHIMCHIPVFCWISATVLQQMFKHSSSTDIPKTLTEMYTYFLLTQTNMKNEKYGGKDETDSKKPLESNREMILKLAKLAFRQLMKGNVMFYEEDLRKCGIDVTEASVYSGICTEIFKEESVLYQRKVYCFVHLSFQEFLAAFHVFYCYASRNLDELKFFKPQNRKWSENVTLDELLRGAVRKALKSENGHLDLFLRFLLGISMESNQKLLQDLLVQTESSSESFSKTVQHIKNLIKTEDLPTERSINLFFCLTEMNDQSLSREIQEYLKSTKHSEKRLSPGQCSALACMLLISEEVLDEFNLKKYNTSVEGYRRLIPAMNNCRKALLAGCNLSMNSCETLCSVLKSPNSSLKELDLSNNDLQDSGVELLCAGLSSLNCKLEILRLSGCMVTEQGCRFLASALISNPSHLKELDLTYNHPGESGQKLLAARLEDKHCTLNNLRLEHAGNIRMKPGPRKYSCELTLDPNTAHTRLSLYELNRKVVGVTQQQSYPDHPERFDCHPQVLCRESVTGRCYWEAEWSGSVDIALTYRSITRKENGKEHAFGWNEKSWILYCSDIGYFVRHNKKKIDIPPPSPSKRVGVYLDCPASTLSFYCVSSGTHTLTHLYTFNTTFTEPLYAGFGVWISDSSVCVCVK